MTESIEVYTPLEKNENDTTVFRFRIGNCFASAVSDDPTVHEACRRSARKQHKTIRILDSKVRLELMAVVNRIKEDDKMDFQELMDIILFEDTEEREPAIQALVELLT